MILAKPIESESFLHNFYIANVLAEMKLPYVLVHLDDFGEANHIANVLADWIFRDDNFTHQKGFGGQSPLIYGFDGKMVKYWHFGAKWPKTAQNSEKQPFRVPKACVCNGRKPRVEPTSEYPRGLNYCWLA